MTEQNPGNVQAQGMGNTALENNCAAVLSIADTVRTTLGPKGLDKLLVDELGNRFITNDGATIMLSVKTVHPVAKLVVEIADRQEEKVGDGTTTAVVLAAEMIKEGKRLITDMGIHPTLIVRGIELGIQRSIELFKQMAININMKDASLAQVISTAAGSRMDGGQIVSLVSDAIGFLKKSNGKKGIINLKKSIFLINNPKLDDMVFDGIVIQKQLFGQQIPDNLDNTKAVLLKIDLKEIKESLVKEMKNYEEIVRMKERQTKMTKEISDSICKTGAGIVFMASAHADEQLMTSLLEKNILMIHVSNEELLNVANALDVQVVRRKEDIGEISVGAFKSVYYDEENGLFFLENHAQQKMVTIIIGGVTKVTSQERWRTVKDGISAAQSALNDGIVAGGGAVELCISEKLKEESLSSGVDSIGIEVVAHALSGIMRQILTNAGYNGFEKMAEIRNKSGEYGIDISTGKEENMFEVGVVDSAGIKINALKSAAEIVKAVLRIDRILIANSPHNAVIEKHANEANFNDK
jgi:chaperonin GroEL (HSP60 family)